MSLQNALGIKSNQLKATKTKSSKTLNESKQVATARLSMKEANKSNSKLIKVTHFVKDGKNAQGEELYKMKTSIVQGNVSQHPTKKDLKVVEVLHIYKETIESDDSNIELLS